MLEPLWSSFMPFCMNQLSVELRVAITSALIEGSSMRAVSRATNVSRNTIEKLLFDLGAICSDYQSQTFKNLNFNRIDCEEIWSFKKAKSRNSVSDEKVDRLGDVWTWVALNKESKLVICWHVGGRNGKIALDFIRDAASRLSNSVRFIINGENAYLEVADAVDDVTIKNINIDLIQKHYGGHIRGASSDSCSDVCAEAKNEEGIRKLSNLEGPIIPMRMGDKGLIRTTHGLGKKIESHEHAIALHYMYHNFCRIQGPQRVTPAMEAGVSAAVWRIEDVVALLD